MTKTGRAAIAVFALAAVLTLTLGGVALAAAGPAPNAGDCVPDGSGFEEPAGAMNGPGPAPNSGDGIPDGPGW